MKEIVFKMRIISRKLRSCDVILFKRIGNNDLINGLKEKRLLHQPSHAYTPSNLKLINQPLGRLLEAAAAEDGNKIALVVRHQNIRKTYSEFNQDVDLLAAGLLALGLKPGDRVGMWGSNTFQWVVTQFATAKAGMILVTVNPAYQKKELEFCLNNVGCSAVITDEKIHNQDYYELLNSVSPDLEKSKGELLNLKNLPHLRRIILNSKTRKPGAVLYNDVVNSVTPADMKTLKNISESVQFDDAVNIQFTSGTTGNPKGATLTHFNIANNAFFVGNRLGFGKNRPVICLPVPLYHCFGCVVGTLTSVIYRGVTVLPSPRFDALACLKAIEAEKCTIVYGTPTMYVDMLENPSFPDSDCSSLINGVMSGANCPVNLIKNVKEKFGIKDIMIPYGCTETSPVCTLTASEDPEDRKVTTVGRPLDYIEVKVIDSQGRVVPVNDQGEVCLRGHATFLGYWEDIEKTKETMTADKWYHTGDLGRMDENGFLHIVGRIKEMVIRGGENIYPREVEEFLLTHPAVSDAHVIGVPDKRLGEELCAWISLKAGSQLVEDDIKTFCKGKISYFKIPKYIIFTDFFPKTVTGKVQKFRMKEESIKRLKVEE